MAKSPHEASATVEPDHIHLFDAKLAELTIQPVQREGWTPKSFILRDKLRKWLNAPADKSSPDSNAAVLLASAYEVWQQPAPPITIQQVVGPGIMKCLTTFCILLEMRQGQLLHHFRRCWIVDARLPMMLTDLQARIVEVLKAVSYTSSDIEHVSWDLAQKFNEKQWKYCAIRLKAGRKTDYLSPEYILPFVDRKLITDKGATAKVYEVGVPEYFLDDILKERSPRPAPHPDLPQLGDIYRFAVKVFEDGHKHLWRQETDAYGALGGSHGMVKYLGDFTLEVAGQVTHNILLEYGENDLYEYFYRSPPVLTQDIHDFWDNLLQIVSAIQGLHDFEVPSLASKATKYKE
jgi:hypothetical protein